ncbi:hypothetical protein GDO86_016406 [Hymenochirus boettgeri]|uniref:Uncharacterized protein n=1 Tax=Hymenochirus boettgeri TaxID=247094 RepID=A0A8T2K5C2_9PIPI|nr:hypothetical protein GDO86_016406 [Hymenochirus boettgeri]
MRRLGEGFIVWISCVKFSEGLGALAHPGQPIIKSGALSTKHHTGPEDSK